MAREVRVLSIDGGGIRGVIPAAVLAEIERRAGRTIPEMFDLVAGTSTGGIIGLGLTVPGDGGAPRWRAADLLELYRREGQHIFSRSVWQRLRTAGGALDEKYPTAGLEAALLRYFGDARLRDALTPVLVTSYELERRKPFFFRSSRAAADPTYDFLMREAARATSAAPTYFEPPQLVNDADGQRYALVDGGVFANNPSMCAHAEVLASDRAADVMVVSLGTGQLNRPIHHADAKDWGLLAWARSIFDVVMDGVSDTTDYQLEQVLGPERHARFQIELIGASDDMDDASAENIAHLETKAHELIAAQDAELDRVCRVLTN